jgi:hypothetical protein
MEVIERVWIFVLILLSASIMASHSVVTADSPETPTDIFYSVKDEDPYEPGIQGLTVEVWTGPVSDPELDTVTCVWSFSDGDQVFGYPEQHINHTFLRGGEKTVQVHTFDGNNYSGFFSIKITLEAAPYPILYPWHCDAGEDRTILKGSSVRLVGSIDSSSGCAVYDVPPIVNWAWSLRVDDTYMEFYGQIFKYTFSKGGEYMIMLSAKNSHNITNNDIVSITVEGPLNYYFSKIPVFLWISSFFMIILIVAIVAVFVLKHKN